jgi:hypothetical protein
MILNRVVMQGDRRSITPSVSSNIGAIPDSFFVYIETYNPKNIDTADIFLVILNAKGDAALASDTLMVLKPGRGDMILTFHHAALALGDYRLVVSARSPKAKADDPMLASAMKNASMPIAVPSASFAARGSTTGQRAVVRRVGTPPPAPP